MCKQRINRQIAILMATKNGCQFIEEQIQSIQSQIGVEVEFYMSDDNSSDDTVTVVENCGLNRISISVGRYGSAAKNFLNLFLTYQPNENTDYIFLSDQDDIWLPKKCIRAIEKMEEYSADAYSGSFYSMLHTNIKFVNKTRNMNGLDHIFSSPGPGFTFAFRKEAFVKLQDLIHRQNLPIDDVRWHDWLIYFVAKENGVVWWIDEKPMTLYRLHGSNDTGQANTMRSVVYRIKFLLSGKFRKQLIILRGAAVLPRTKRILDLVFDFSLFAKIQLSSSVLLSRKSLKDRVALFIWLYFSRR